MNDYSLYAADEAGPLLTFNGEYRLHRHRDLDIRHLRARIVRAIARRRPRIRHTALTR